MVSMYGQPKEAPSIASPVASPVAVVLWLALLATVAIGVGVQIFLSQVA